jgi:GDP-4-dehydro-6-deoxy-D-mannose reductase
MKVFISGAGGFTGHYLIDELYKNSDIEDPEIFGLRHRTRVGTEDINYEIVEGDLLDYSRIESLISEISPDIIIHLAGLTKGTTAELLKVNIAGTENLLNAIHHSGISPRILITSSSAEYGYQGDYPIDESAKIMPLSPYGISKAGLSLLSLMYLRKYSLPICIVRPFNLVGPGQKKDFFCGNLIAQFIACDRGNQDEITLVNPESRRDYTDVRDVVRAYRQLLFHPDYDTVCRGKIFNIGSGRSYSVFDTFGIIEEIMGKTYKYKILPSAGDLIPGQICDYGLINRTTGWKPTISFADSLKDMVEGRKINSQIIGRH